MKNALFIKSFCCISASISLCRRLLCCTNDAIVGPAGPIEHIVHPKPLKTDQYWIYSSSLRENNHIFVGCAATSQFARAIGNKHTRRTLNTSVCFMLAALH